MDDKRVTNLGCPFEERRTTVMSMSSPLAGSVVEME